MKQNKKRQSRSKRSENLRSKCNKTMTQAIKTNEKAKDGRSPLGRREKKEGETDVKAEKRDAHRNSVCVCVCGQRREMILKITRNANGKVPNQPKSKY